MNQIVPVEYRVKESEFFAGDEGAIMDTIVSHVSNGGTLVTLAETWGVRYGVLNGWIARDPVRLKGMNLAMNARGEWEREVILGQLRNIGTLDIRKLLAEDGSLLPVSKWPAESASALAGIEVRAREGRDGAAELSKKIKLNDRLRALELLGKEIGMFSNRVEVGVKVTLESMVMDSMRVTVDELPEAGGALMPFALPATTAPDPVEPVAPLAPSGPSAPSVEIEVLDVI